MVLALMRWVNDQPLRDSAWAAMKSWFTFNLATLLDRGLKPTLEQAHLQLKDGTGADEFPKIKDQLLKQLDALLVTLPDDANAQQSLSGVRTRLLNVGQ